MEEFRHLIDRFYTPRRIDFFHFLAQFIKALLCFFLPSNMVRRGRIKAVELAYLFAYASHAMS